jgi:hypothetical protein
MANDHVMIDIETLGTDPGSVIASVGLVRFDPQAGVQSAEELLKSSLKVVIDIEESIADGFTVSGSTIKWWFNQSREAQKSTFGGKEQLLPTVALREIISFFNLSDKVWGNGANFDIVLLESYFRHYQFALPWKYNKVRCHRTVVNMHCIDMGYPIPVNALPHDPVADCIAQVQRLQSIAIKNLTIEWM